jgi:hypothetical protein
MDSRREPPSSAGDEPSSAGRAVDQPFWKQHAGALLAAVAVVVAAVIGAVVGIAGTLATNWQQERSGELQYHGDLVLRALEPDDVEAREEQLRFLLDTKLLADEEIRDGLEDYLGRSDELPQFGSSQTIQGMTQVAVVGPDEYEVDRDGDRIACE